MNANTGLYARVLGDRLDTLDDAVRVLHSLRGAQRLIGEVTIVGAERLPGRWIAALLGLPAAAQRVAFTFEWREDGSEEIWTRRFPRRTMTSRLYQLPSGLLGERLGPARLSFALAAERGRLSMHLLDIHVFGLRWPRRWLPVVWAHERGDAAHFHFDVGAHLGALGMLVAYSGHLDLASTEPLR